jgi:hypothetical protein
MLSVTFSYSYARLDVIVQSVFMQNVIVLSVIMLSVTFSYSYAGLDVIVRAECHHAYCHYAECRGTEKKLVLLAFLQMQNVEENFASNLFLQILLNSKTDFQTASFVLREMLILLYKTTYPSQQSHNFSDL